MNSCMDDAWPSPADSVVKRRRQQPLAPTRRRRPKQRHEQGVRLSVAAGDAAGNRLEISDFLGADNNTGRSISSAAAPVSGTPEIWSRARGERERGGGG